MGLGGHEADIGFTQACFDAFRSDADAHPEFVSTSLAPDSEDAARLPCLATGTPQAATIKAARVEIL